MQEQDFTIANFTELIVGVIAIFGKHTSAAIMFLGLMIYEAARLLIPREEKKEWNFGIGYNFFLD